MKVVHLLSLMLIVTLSSCLKDPGVPSISTSKTTVAVDETVVLNLSNTENASCAYFYWQCPDCPEDSDYELISGSFGIGTTPVNSTVSLKFKNTGVYKIHAVSNNCNDKNNPCSGKCKGGTAEITITVQ